jgi:hypothetical protein
MRVVASVLVALAAQQAVAAQSDSASLRGVSTCGVGQYFAHKSKAGVEKSKCSHCPVGTYQDNASHNKGSCTACPEGFTTASRGATSADACSVASASRQLTMAPRIEGATPLCQTDMNGYNYTDTCTFTFTGAELTIDAQVDDYPEEVKIVITKPDGTDHVFDYVFATEEYEEFLPLITFTATGEYTITIIDGYGDGGCEVVAYVSEEADPGYVRASMEVPGLACSALRTGPTGVAADLSAAIGSVVGVDAGAVSILKLQACGEVFYTADITGATPARFLKAAKKNRAKARRLNSIVRQGRGLAQQSSVGRRTQATSTMNVEFQVATTADNTASMAAQMSHALPSQLSSALNAIDSGSYTSTAPSSFGSSPYQSGGNTVITAPPAQKTKGGRGKSTYSYASSSYGGSSGASSGSSFGASAASGAAARAAGRARLIWNTKGMRREDL